MMFPREEDLEIINSPPTQLELDKGWRKLAPISTMKNRTVYTYQCLHCKNVYKNHKNAIQHLSICPILHPTTKQNSILTFFAHREDENIADDQCVQDIIELIAAHNIPYTQLTGSPYWANLFKHLNPSFVLPTKEQLNKAIKAYANTLESKSYSSLTGKTVGVCIDGAGFNIEKYYAVVLINAEKARLAKVYHVENQTADALSDIVADVYKKASLKGVNIAGTCSDNAKNLVAALEGKSDKCLNAKIGSYLLRVSCSAHTSQLSIVDIRKLDETIDQIINDALELAKYIDRRDDTFRSYIDVERPVFIATRWNSACNVIEFMVENSEQVNAFIMACYVKEDSAYQRRIEKNEQRVARGEEPKEVHPPSYPPVREVTIHWKMLLDSLKVIRTFTTRIEGDITLQQEVFLEARNVSFSLTALEVNGNQFAAILRNAFEERFMTTADILISELAWRFTPKGVIEWRNTFLSDMNSDDEERSKRAYEHYVELSNRFVALSEEIFEIKTDQQRAEFGFPALFKWWLESSPIDPGNSVSSMWLQMKFRKIVIPDFNDGNPISLQNFCKIGMAMTSLPASESICERCFSQIKHLATDLNHNMKPELFESLATIKMACYYFNKYQ